MLAASTGLPFNTRYLSDGPMEEARLVASGLASVCIWTEMSRLCLDLFGENPSGCSIDTSTQTYKETTGQLLGLTYLAIYNVWIDLSMAWRRGQGGKFVDFPKNHTWHAAGVWALPSWKLREPSWEHRASHYSDWAIEQYIYTLSVFCQGEGHTTDIAMECEFPPSQRNEAELVNSGASRAHTATIPRARESHA